MTEEEIINKIFSGKVEFKSPYVKDIVKISNVEFFLKKHKMPVPRIIIRLRMQLEKEQKKWEKEIAG